jgi:hypothetical protein
MTKKIIPCLVVFIFVSGCAGFQGKQLDRISNMPRIDEPKKVHISMDFHRKLNNAPSTLLNETKKQNALRNAKAVFNRQSNITVVDDENAADVKLKLDFTEHEHSNLGMAVLTGLSFYMIPSQSTLEFTAKVNPSETLERDFSVSDYTTIYQQIFLVPVMLFKFPSVEVNDTQNKIFRHILLRLHEQKIVRLDPGTFRSNSMRIASQSNYNPQMPSPSSFESRL